MMKKIITLIFLLFFPKLFAYDYPWPVDYRFKINSQDDVNEIIEKFIYENSKFQIYDFDWNDYAADGEINDDDFELFLRYAEQSPFGVVLLSGVYLDDVRSAVSFRILPVSDSSGGYIILRLYGYAIDIENIKGKNVYSKNSRGNYFNDVEPLKEESSIKESFEKTFYQNCHWSMNILNPEI